MSSPCADCPFRSDKPPFLRHGRAVEIADMLRGGGHFHCHKTLDYDNDDGEGVVRSESQLCAGALITLERGERGAMFTSNLVRIFARTGWNPDELNMKAPVYAGLDAWIAAHEEPSRGSSPKKARGRTTRARRSEHRLPKPEDEGVTSLPRVPNKRKRGKR
jgi:hypothetical protein